jgi:hypothetical protein
MLPPVLPVVQTSERSILYFLYTLFLFREPHQARMTGGRSLSLETSEPLYLLQYPELLKGQLFSFPAHISFFYSQAFVWVFTEV